MTKKLPRLFLPSTASLRSLEALDRLGSVTAAAKELNLSQSAVSRQIQKLEESLGVDLAFRKGRNLLLADEASNYAAEIRYALDKITQATHKIIINPEGGKLDLAVLPAFGAQWLLPRLANFSRCHPEITVNLSTRLKPFNFSMERFDAAINFRSDDWPGTESLWLKGETVVAVCSPNFLKANSFRDVHDLLSLPLLHIETRPNAWSEWFYAHGVEYIMPRGTMYDHFAIIIQATVHGLGVALLPDYLVEKELEFGSLTTVWGQPINIPGGYHLIWPREKSYNPVLVKFRNWITTEIASTTTSLNS